MSTCPRGRLAAGGRAASAGWRPFLVAPAAALGLLVGAAQAVPAVWADDPAISVSFTALPAGWQDAGLDGCGVSPDNVQLNSGWNTHAQDFAGCVTRFKLGSETEGAGLAFVAVGTARRSFRNLDEFRSYVRSQSAGFGSQLQPSTAKLQGRDAYLVVLDTTQRILGMGADGNYKTTVATTHGENYWVSLGTGRTAFVRLGVMTIDESPDSWKGEASAILAALGLQTAGEPPPAAAPAATPAPGACHAAIRLPRVRPGDTLAPSVTVSSADGKPVQGPTAAVWYINGRQTNSVVWDGTETAVLLQLSCQGQAQELRATMAAYTFVTEREPGKGPPLIPPLGAPPLGLGQVGQVPGPRSLGEALVGVLGAPAIGLIGTVIGAIARGATAVGTVWSPPSTGPATPPVAPPPTGGPPATPPATPKPPEKPAEKPPEKPPAPPAPTPATLRARRALQRMAQLARMTRDPRMRGILERFQREGFGADGNVVDQRWDAFRREFGAAMQGTMGTGNGALGVKDWMRVGLEGSMGTVTGIVGAAKDVKDAAVGVVTGSGHIIGAGLDAVLSPLQTAKALDQAVKGWVSNSLFAERKAIQDALKEGRTLDALMAMGSLAGAAGGKFSSAAWGLVKEALPLEEMKVWGEVLSGKKSITDEDFLWSIPSAAVKVASLATMSERLAVVKVPGLGPNSTFISSARTASAKMADVAEAAAARAGQAGVSAKTVQEAEHLTRTARATQRMESLVEQGVPKPRNFKDAQRLLENNPELRRAADEALRSNQGTNNLYNLRGGGVMSEDAHTLLTARKLQLQEEAMNSAAKRLFKEEVEARLAVGDHVPGRLHTFNATQGSRVNIGGSNVNADLDQTFLGLKHIPKDRIERVLNEEAARLGMDRKTLDMNIYRPGQGLSDVRGAAPNSQRVLENIGQQTGTSQQFQVHITRSGEVIIGDPVTAQGREAVMAARRSIVQEIGDPDKQRVLNRWTWEGHQGAPVQVLGAAERAAAMGAQMNGLRHAAELNQMVKYGNRLSSLGFEMDLETRQLLRQVFGEKDAFKAKALLDAAGVRTPADLLNRMKV